MWVLSHSEYSVKSVEKLWRKRAWLFKVKVNFHSQTWAHRIKSKDLLHRKYHWSVSLSLHWVPDFPLIWRLEFCSRRSLHSSWILKKQFLERVIWSAMHSFKRITRTSGSKHQQNWNSGGHWTVTVDLSNFIIWGLNLCNN